ncbi:MAG: gamma-glutamyl-gamma-aminobutyrate hydrolase family protein [Alphaproteobacteria bacterium]|nr:gamma-glutamyl-gamma-aminobutyrate hydrolase family protein [Alphaproteobacteria bacterium]
MPRKKPIVGIPCDHRMIGPHPFHAVGEKYIVAVSDGANAIPLLIPVLDKPIDIEEILETVDGVLLTGSPSNVAPKRYGGTSPREGVLQDERRDATTLPLIRAIIDQGTPLLAVCRGFQELNVAYGGTLFQHVEEVPGRFDHREDKTAPLDVQYAPVHDVKLSGTLEDIFGRPQIRVNSLHGQGIDRLGEGLVAEAIAPDGQIEGVRVKEAKAFALGVQWHPEWRFWENGFSKALFAAFGEAMR